MTTGNSQCADPRPLRVLVIDDDAVDRKVIRRALAKCGVATEIDEIDDSTDGTRAILEGGYDCVFLDYLLPGIDGLEVLQRARAGENLVPIVMLTGHGDEQLAATLMRAGASDYMPKDAISPETLGRSLGGAVRMHRLEAERRQTEEALRRSKAQIGDILESISDAFFAIDACGMFTYVNAPAEELLQRARGELLGECIWTKLDESAGRLREHLKTALSERTRAQFEWHLAERNLWYEAHVYPQSGGLSTYLRDVTARKVAEEQLIHQANHDALTGLPNRSLLMDRINQALTRAPWHDRFVAILFCDLDRFKVVNDSLGHAVGDELLKMAARRLERSARDGDTVARLGGDEFVVVLSDVASMDDIERVAKKILQAITEPYRIGDHELVVTTSVGVSMYPADGRDEATLLKNADTAMYRAKETGRNNFALYTPSMSEAARARLALESDLRRAIARNEFRLHYQPMLDVRTGEVIATEALLRWQHPERGLLAPDAFLATAEEAGLIVPIGEWVLKEACARNSDWLRRGVVSVPVSVNLSHRQFSQDTLVDRISDALNETGLAPRLLEVELTETIVMDRVEGAIGPLNALRDLGVRVAIDDFGTGYSSLAYLKRLPLDVLKVDRSFVTDITSDPNGGVIVSAISAMARKLNLSVVVEGVETRDQLDCLLDQGCDAVQGYYFTQPLPAAEYERFVQSWRPASFPGVARSLLGTLGDDDAPPSPLSPGRTAAVIEAVRAVKWN